jgi:hypothetical protein
MSTRLLETRRELKQTYRKIIVRQFGHLKELYRDARSTEHKILFNLLAVTTWSLADVSWNLLYVGLDVAFAVYSQFRTKEMHLKGNTVIFWIKHDEWPIRDIISFCMLEPIPHNLPNMISLNLV